MEGIHYGKDDENLGCGCTRQLVGIYLTPLHFGGAPQEENLQVKGEMWDLNK